MLAQTALARTALALLAQISFAQTALAQPADPSEPLQNVRFEYRAPVSCPSERVFVERVRERLLNAADTASLPQALAIGVVVTPDTEEAIVTFRESDGRRLDRTVKGETCDELVSGAALIVALALGGENRAGAPVAPKPPPPTGPSSDSGQAIGEPPPVSQQTTVSAEPAPEAASAAGSTGMSRQSQADVRTVERVATPTPAIPKDEDRLAPSAPTGPALGWAAGAGIHVNTWQAERPNLGVDIFASASEVEAGFSLRASAMYSDFDIAVGSRTAGFFYLGGRLEGCPVWLSLLSTVVLEPCLAVGMGMLRGQGHSDSALVASAADGIFWADLVGIARLRLLLTSRLVLEAQAEVGAPLVRHTFVFEDPREVVLQVGALGFAGRLGLGVPFL